MVLAIDFSVLVKYVIFLNFFGLMTAFANVDFIRRSYIKRTF